MQQELNKQLIELSSALNKLWQSLDQEDNFPLGLTCLGVNSPKASLSLIRNIENTRDALCDTRQPTANWEDPNALATLRAHFDARLALFSELKEAIEQKHNTAEENNRLDDAIRDVHTHLKTICHDIQAIIDKIDTAPNLKHSTLSAREVAMRRSMLTDYTKATTLKSFLGSIAETLIATGHLEQKLAETDGYSAVLTQKQDDTRDAFIEKSLLNPGELRNTVKADLANKEQPPAKYTL